jgi:hypothetical protein
MIPLFAAAEIAYDQVFSTRRADGRAAAPISEDELMEGMFWGGATRFELGNGHSTVTQLSVRVSDLERVMAELRSRPLEL